MYNDFPDADTIIKSAIFGKENRQQHKQQHKIFTTQSESLITVQKQQALLLIRVEIMKPVFSMHFVFLKCNFQITGGVICSESSA